MSDVEMLADSGSGFRRMRLHLPAATQAGSLYSEPEHPEMDSKGSTSTWPNSLCAPRLLQLLLSSYCLL